LLFTLCVFAALREPPFAVAVGLSPFASLRLCVSRRLTLPLLFLPFAFSAVKGF
jgi:hypothetical protein